MKKFKLKVITHNSLRNKYVYADEVLGEKAGYYCFFNKIPATNANFTIEEVAMYPINSTIICSIEKVKKRLPVQSKDE